MSETNNIKIGWPQSSKAQDLGRKGKTQLEYIVVHLFGWIFRPTPQEHDFGIDGYIDIVDKGNVTGQSIAVQVKCGDSYIKKTKNGYRYDGEAKHLNYYLNIQTPVIFIIFSENLNVSYWDVFDVEKTNPSKSGWWTELCEKNHFDISSKHTLENIAGPAKNFEESIKEIWKTNELIKKSRSMFFLISKADIEHQDFNGIKRTIDRLSKSSDLLLAARCSCEIYLPDYDDDPREIWEIQEIRHWFDLSISLGIPWFYFLNSTHQYTGLLLLINCACFSQYIKTNHDKHLVEIDVEKLEEWIIKNFSNLNYFTEKNGISLEINKEISFKIKEFLKKRVTYEEW